MRIYRQITLAIALIVLLGAVCTQISANAADGNAQQEEILWEDGSAGTDGYPEEEYQYPGEQDDFPAEEPDGNFTAAPADETDADETDADPDQAEASAEDSTAAEAENPAEAAAEDPILPQNGIPVVIIEIDESEGNSTIDEMNSSSDHSVRCTGTMQIVVPEGFTYCDMDGTPKDLGPVKLEYIRGRGNSTWDQSKKPYKIKLDKKADVLGLGSNKHWVLLANSMDTTVIKNRFVGVMGDQLGFEYTPNGVPVDVVMVARKDGEEVSRRDLGSYLLAEHIRVGKDRLDIHELTADETAPEEITGGYIVQYGHQVGEDSPDKFFTDRGQNLANNSPTFDPADGDYTNEQQKEYIRDHIQKAENAIFGEGVEEGDPFADGDGIRYNEYMDMESAAKYWLVQEISGNRDGYGTGSTYFYKKEDRFDDSGSRTRMGKIYWGPLWDFDVAFGNGVTDEEITGFNFSAEKWIGAMLYDDDPDGFRRTAQKVWPQVRDAFLAALEDGGLVDRYYEETKSSYESDYEIWKDQGGYYYENRDDFRRNVDILKEWTKKRIAWLDGHMSGTAEDGEDTADSAVSRVTYIVDGRTVRREYYPRNESCHLYTPDDNSWQGFKPEKEGYILAGWLDEEGNSAGNAASVTTDRVFTADFVKKEDAVAAEEIIFRSDREVYVLQDGSFVSRYTILPSDALDKSCAWTSSDESVAVVDGTGRVRCLGTGTVTITATLKSGAGASYELIVVDEETPPEDLVLDTDKIELPVGGHEKIGYTILPETAVVFDVWIGEKDGNIATVDPNGVVTGLRAGTTEITVEIRYHDEAGDPAGIVKKCTVVVYEGEDIGPEPEPVAPEPHKLVKRNAIKPTCTEDGVTAYWVCSDCGKLFSDDEGKQEILKKDTVVKALGHDWGEWTVVMKATTAEEGLEESACKRCGETRQRAIPKREVEHERGGEDEKEPGGGSADGKYRDTTDTGDKSTPGLWILLAAGAIAGIGVIVLTRRGH